MRQLVKLVLGTLILVFSGCTKDFREINTNRNNPTSVTPDLLLSGVIRSTMNQQVSEAWSIGNLVAQYNAKIQFVNEDRYLWGMSSFEIVDVCTINRSLW